MAERGRMAFKTKINYFLSEGRFKDSKTKSDVSFAD